MPRLPRNHIKTSFIHVITQGINKSYIFDKKEDILHYIKIMYEIKEKLNVKIIAYCIMNNHAHLLLKVEEILVLSKYMQKLNTKYAIYYNKKYNRVGYIFRSRYKSEGIYNEKHLYSCINYIHNNPVKAKICNSPEEYKYSNYKNFKQKMQKHYENYEYLEVEEIQKEKCKEIIKEFLDKNTLDKEELRINKTKLKELVKKLKTYNNISYRKIEKEIEISRETLRKLLN